MQLQKVAKKNSFQSVSKLQNIKRHRFLYLLILPGILWFVIFKYIPMYFLQVAFRDYNVFVSLSESNWVGLDNFVKLFTSRYFLQALSNTLIISGMKLLFGFPVPIILAILLNELRRQRFKKTVQTLLYLPHFLSWVIVGGMWAVILSPTGGIVNEFLALFGMDPIFFMADKSWFRWVLLFSDIWKGAGWGTIVYLAAISGIDSEMYEAAMIDGANKFQQAIRITIPSIVIPITVVFILRLGKVLNVFQQVFVMYNPAVSEVSETIGTYVYQVGMQKGDLSYAIAAGLFKNIVSLILILGTNKIAKKAQGFSII
ncbi:ABC transporter permease [Vallitalea okinawensis]|uniref:ABC transporter permease n=1 Tax=Vallitalea okinawensis TaxID=2078660 RepID=UPI000CFC7C78|nr:ABC transporter permease subunit [Vallitalea okinawensis]